MKSVLITGANGSLSCKTAHHLASKENFNVKQLSLRGESWRDVDFCKIDCIVHLAGVTPQNVKNDSDYETINFLLTKELAGKAINEGVKQFIYISSMAVYGMGQSINKKNGQIDETTPCLPVTEYGRSKLNAEEYLRTLHNEDFKVCVIRVPSIFDDKKTEYMDQYKYLADKYPFIPKAFTHNYKSFIHSDNLCELIYLSVISEYDGVICPDDGKFSAFDICRSIYPNKLKSKFFGIIIELFMKNNPRIIDYYGAIYYCDKLTNVFDGKYRIINDYDAIRNLYE